MIGRMVLPLAGGTPAVWTTCLMFFQAGLLAGYLYAHLTTRWLPLRVQMAVHAIARPDQILFAADLPKTRSGKIMRRLLRDIAEGKTLGDTTTLADPNVVARLKDEYESTET